MFSSNFMQSTPRLTIPDLVILASSQDTSLSIFHYRNIKSLQLSRFSCFIRISISLCSFYSFTFPTVTAVVHL